MKVVSHYCFLVFFLVVFLLNSSNIHARSLTTKHQGEVEVEFKGVVIDEISNLHLETNDSPSFDRLMGLEKCENEDNKECLTRRVLEEAHLDYIYTQHYKP